ncbi:MAG: hypothetical protein ACREEM_30680 [Blastocatellia bacterium]
MHLTGNLREKPATHSVQCALESLGAGASASSLPFSAHDITAGSESELQAVVIGDKGAVDLARTIERSNYYANIARRIAAGDTSKRAIVELERYLNENEEGVWENSWVWFPQRLLCRFARETFQSDLLADKRDHRRGLRSDRGRFLVSEEGESFIRIPVSYLLKLALAEAIGSQTDLPSGIAATGVRVMSHFLNDNTSPETFSFHLSSAGQGSGIGRSVAREKAKRFLLSQLLVMFANRRLGLEASGQRAMIYFAPHPPVRQKQLNNSISDAFYRELFMSPCLSGWDEGESKHAYMSLCHQVLSRSQLAAVAKLREAGIVVNNLVVLPNLSNISLANNGTHVSLGSRMMTEAMRGGSREFGVAEEKQIGDLTIKIVEHFLPLFVGTYSAAPYRFDFADFHPENVLGFLPHELDYTHLRMIWRRWRKKAGLNVFGYRLTPFGPQWIDRSLSALFRLRGDWVTDFRLIDYPVALMSTERSPALDGAPGNGDRLKRDLADQGVFDTKMSLYLPYRLREFAAMGFTGFEGRHYSLFESLGDDLSRAVDLQALITALAMKYQMQGRLTHAHIPDSPFIESERRQIFFDAAIGIPTFFVRRDTPNQLLRGILARTTRTRSSRRYPGFVRVHNDDYRQALVKTLMEDGADLIEMFGFEETIRDLQARLHDSAGQSAAGKLTRGILAGSGRRSPARPMEMKAEEFNRRAETYYRGPLRERHLAEAFRFLIEDLRALELIETSFDDDLRQTLHQLLGGRSATEIAEEAQRAIVSGQADEAEIGMLINLTLLSIGADLKASERIPDEERRAGSAAASAASIH